MAGVGPWVWAVYLILSQSPTYQLIHSWKAGAVEVWCECEKWKEGIISGSILMANSLSLSMKILLTQMPNPTPKKENSQDAICPSPVNWQHYEMGNQSGFHPHLCLPLLIGISRWSDEPFLLLHQHTSNSHLQNYHRIQSDMKLGPSNSHWFINCCLLPPICGQSTKKNNRNLMFCPVLTWLRFWIIWLGVRYFGAGRDGDDAWGGSGMNMPAFPWVEAKSGLYCCLGGMLGSRSWMHSNGSRCRANSALLMLQVKKLPAMELQSLFDATSNPNMCLKCHLG